MRKQSKFQSAKTLIPVASKQGHERIFPLALHAYFPTNHRRATRNLTREGLDNIQDDSRMPSLRGILVMNKATHADLHRVLEESSHHNTRNTNSTQLKIWL